MLSSFIIFRFWQVVKHGAINNRPINANSVRKSLAKALRSIGIQQKERGLKFHSFRHFFNTYLQKEDVNVNKIKSVMGHKDSSMTGVYTNWNANEFPEVYEAQEKLIRRIL